MEINKSTRDVIVKEMTNKLEIIFILPHHGWNYKFIKEAGFDVYDPYIGNSITFRILRELIFRLNLPGKKWWFNKKNIVHDKIIFVYESLIIPDFMKWLHDKTINCRIILFYSNPVNSSVNPKLISDDWCEKWTVDFEDAKKYNLNCYDGGGYFTQWKVKKSEPIYDVVYVGKDKNRLEKINELQDNFERLGLKTYFHIVPERRYQLMKNKSYKRFMPYEEVLELIGKTKAILHLSDGCQKGITIRIAESLIHKIKLITDDKNIVDCDFYNPNNIFILGVDDLNILSEFLNKPFAEVKSSFYDHPYFEDMVGYVTGIDFGVDK